MNVIESALKGSKRKIIAADLFCGAGGLSEGLKEACEALGIEVELVAVNHNEQAIATHRANHKDARQYCNSVQGINPIDIVPGGYLDILAAGVECTNISRARGGGPLNEQSRSNLWDICRWADKLIVKHILIENVPEFIELGPLFHDCQCGAGIQAKVHAKGCHFMRPIPDRKGEHFRNFVRNLKTLGYTVDWRILRCCDFGDPTSRKRFFLQAVKGKNQKITWPEPTHYPANALPLSQEATAPVKRWRAAREIIDWSLRGHSIYMDPEKAKSLGLKRPLSPNTLRRIFAGLRKFSGLPFLTDFSASPTGKIKDSKSELPAHFLRPYLVVLRKNCTASSIDEPLPTICTATNQLWLAQPLLQPIIMVNRTHNTGIDLDSPLPTLCTGNHMGLIQPFLMQSAHSSEGDDRRCMPLERPAPTLTTNQELGLVHPVLSPSMEALTMGQQSCAAARPVSQPVPTIATQGKVSLITPSFEAVLTKYHGGAPRVHSLDDPIATLDTSNRFGLVRAELIPPCLSCYYGTGDGQSIDDPLRTVTTRDRHALVQAGLIRWDIEADVYLLDIEYRFLAAHELAGAHSYPKTYVFTGSKEKQIAQIGNSVPIQMGRALFECALRPQPTARRRTRAQASA